MNKSPFDPTGLERAAQALRELNNSPHAAKALDVMIKTEEAKRAEKTAQAKQNEIAKVKTEGEERRRNMDHQKQNNLAIAEHNDKMERQRWRDKLSEQEASQRNQREEQEESVRRQEEMRRDTMNLQMQKQYELEERKIMLQSKLNADNYRKNFDLISKENESKHLIEQRTRMDIHTLYLSKFKEGFQYLQNNPQGVVTLGKTMLFMSAGLYFSKYSLGLMFRRLEALLVRPSLVRETSRRSIKWMMPSQKRIFDRVVLNNELEKNLKVITAGFIGKRRNDKPLRNFLFHGPPGTGKTLFAKQLAFNSGLHYAVISGGDMDKLGDQAVPEIDKLFQWCQSTPKGTIIFIDEAEAIFCKRSQQNKTSAALSSFLAQTSAASSKFSLILATNLPDKLDEAILDRLDQIVGFEYLNEKQRAVLLNKGLNDMRLSSWRMFNRGISIDYTITEEQVQELARQMNNFSPRQIDKFVLSVHDAALGEAVLQQQMQYQIDIEFINRILERCQQENICRQQWSKL